MNFPLPLPVERAIRALGSDLSRARRRRRFSQGSLAERAGISLSTLRRLEAGDPSVGLEAVARVMHVLGEVDRLGQLLATGEDALGLQLMDEQLPKRVRRRSGSGVL
jgi:transcriptional regulator with XRE-family HTH domain